jgi:hypothetical protein
MLHNIKKRENPPRKLKWVKRRYYAHEYLWYPLYERWGYPRRPDDSFPKPCGFEEGARKTEWQTAN